jgi:hypothetical protein
MKSLLNFKSLEVANAEEIKGGTGCVFNPVTPSGPGCPPPFCPPVVCQPAPVCPTPICYSTKKTKKTKKGKC